MKQIAVISGKGGTGKTILTASFAALAKNKIMVDCDVDAADLHLLLHPDIKQRNEFKSGKTAHIDEKICIHCGKCLSACRFEAMREDFKIDSISCEGCGLCSHICPVMAIKMEENLAGEWFVSETKYGPFIHAQLGIAEENSGKLVAKIRQVAKKLTEEKNFNYIIIDGPPGIGCPVIASLSGVNLAVIITEPTVSGLHDLLRIIELTGHFQITSKVVINKYDLNLGNTNIIKLSCKEKDIEILGCIPFSSSVSKAIVNGLSPVEYCNDGVANEIISIWTKIADYLLKM